MTICSGNSGTVAVGLGVASGVGFWVGVDCRGVGEDENVDSMAAVVISG